MKILITIYAILLGATVAIGATPRLMAVPVESFIKSGGAVSIDLFLYNEGKTEIKAQTLEQWSASCRLRDLGRKGEERTVSFGEVVDHPSNPTNMAPRSLQHRRIQLKIQPTKGELAEIYFEIGEKRKFRSNTVLLFCPL